MFFFEFLLNYSHFTPFICPLPLYLGWWSPLVAGRQAKESKEAEARPLRIYIDK